MRIMMYRFRDYVRVCPKRALKIEMTPNQSIPGAHTPKESNGDTA
jgi:hypothetical protein